MIAMRVVGPMMTMTTMIDLDEPIPMVQSMVVASSMVKCPIRKWHLRIRNVGVS